MHSILLHLDAACQQRLCNGTHSVWHGAVAQCMPLQVQLDPRLQRMTGASSDGIVACFGAKWLQLLCNAYHAIITYGASAAD
jgi:hypothetical protein